MFGLNIRKAFCFILGMAAVLLLPSLSFATIYLPPVTVTGDHINHTYENDEYGAQAYDYLVGDGTNGEPAPDITVNLQADPDKKIVYTISAPSGKTISVRKPEPGNLSFAGLLFFGSFDGSGVWYPETVFFDEVEASNDLTGYIYSNGTTPTGVNFWISGHLSEGISFTTMRITINYSGGSFIDDSYTLSRFFGEIYFYWDDPAGTGDPLQFVTVDAVPEPSLTTLFVVGAVGSIGMLMKKRARG